MFLCINCGWLFVFDDAAVPTVTGKCVCARCYYALTGELRQPTVQLRREVEEVLKGASAL